MKAIQLVRDKVLFPGLAQGGNSQPKVSAMEMSREQEKEEIRTLFRGNGTLYYSDIVEKSGISLRTVVEICEELKASGEIALGKRV